MTNVGLFFTSPYDLELVDYVDKYVPAYKISSRRYNLFEIVNDYPAKKAGDLTSRTN